MKAGFKSFKSYCCEFRFLAFFSGNDSNAQVDATRKVEEWITKIEGLSSQPVIPRDGGIFGIEKLIRLPRGQARISIPNTVPQNDDKSYWVSIIQAEVHTESALNHILKEGKRPFWSFHWNMKGNIDVNALVSEISYQTGLTPSSSSSMEIGPDDHVIVNAEYSIPIDNRKIRISIAGGWSGETSASLGLIPERSQDGGLIRAHEIFSPDDILSFLRGEVSLPDFRAMARRAINDSKGI